MLIKIIPLVLLLVSCAGLEVERRKAADCDITDRPYGREGKVEVVCPDLRFRIVYDNIPDGRDPTVLRVEGVEARKVSEEREDRFTVEFAHEVLEGWAYREVWEIGEGYRLESLEYFVNGGSSCYEEEEAIRVVLSYRGDKITVLDYFHEETDCGSH
ncbi:MAG: hypothetical protein Q9N26_00285 [Aquificota bacterium]|nr:hypothetical protein [Aquificota bacterium]MDQ7083398.1 hypothetical protein [Aquificota bacterium]